MRHFDACFAGCPSKVDAKQMGMISTRISHLLIHTLKIIKHCNLDTDSQPDELVGQIMTDLDVKCIMSNIVLHKLIFGGLLN